jgi:hypothetical protein
VGLAGCNPAPGEAAITLTGAERAVLDGPAVACPPPGTGGETLTHWVWEGDIGGEPARVAFAGTFSEVVDTAVVQIGNLEAPSGHGTRWYYAAPLAIPPSGAVTQLGVDDDGTLHATATLPSVNGGGPVEVEAALRCPEPT